MADLIPMFKGKPAPQPPAGAPPPKRPPFRPFSPGEAVHNADGTVSTERTITWQMPDGQWVNTPTLFKTPNGTLDLSAPDSEEQARQAANVLMRSGMRFPTFANEQEAAAFARERSAAGGVSAQ